MDQHIKKVRAHAEETLVSKSERSRADLIKLYKRFLKMEEHRIKLQHRAGASGLEISKKRSDLLDIVLNNLFTEALADVDLGLKNSQVTLVAHGGYGRGLLNPGSDIDLLFLTEKSGSALSAQVTEVVEQVLYMLWDVGFKVGHATRSIGESIKQANADLITKTTMIESRLITGEPELFDKFQERFRRDCIDGREEEYIEDRKLDMRSRYAKHDNTVFLQEPHVKNGVGGLRDVHNSIWISYVKRDVRDLAKLVELKVLTRNAYREFERAHDFLLRVRNDLHYSEKRATDILTLRLQGVVSTNLGYPQKNILKRTEAFMKDYYMHTRAMSQHMTSLLERFEIEISAEPASPGRRIVNFITASGGPETEKFGEFKSRDGYLYSTSPKIFEDDSDNIIRTFLHVAQRGLRLSPQLRQQIKRRWGLIDRTFRYRKSVRDTFEAILMRKGDVSRVLRSMHRAGFLGRYLPEFGALDCLVQHEFFHRYTADEHTLACIDQLDALSDTEDPKQLFYQELFQKMEDPFPIYLSLILHDTGRAENAATHVDASTTLAAKVCNRLCVRLDRRRLITFLVDNHLTLYRTATTKNLSDTTVISDFAAIVRNQHYLDMLMLHTYADSRGTNIEGFTSWKESLMRQLYQTTSLFLRDKGAFDARQDVPAKPVRKEALAKLPSGITPEDLDAHFKVMPRRYFLFRSATAVVRHLKVVEKYKTQAPKPALGWQDRASSGTTELTVVAKDHRGFLAMVTGALAAAKINILGADLFVRSDGLAVNVFRICTLSFTPVSDKTLRRTVGQFIGEACCKEFDFAPLIRKVSPDTPQPDAYDASFPSRVYISNDANPDFTVIEIQALDRIGLLYDVFCAIGKLGYNVELARINTEKGAAVDNIYIKAPDGNKVIERDELNALADTLESYVSVSA